MSQDTTRHPLSDPNVAISYATYQIRQDLAELVKTIPAITDATVAEEVETDLREIAHDVTRCALAIQTQRLAVAV